ncbi:MAG: P63C domain-containing protein, partial [Litorimonas sp.]
MAKEPRIIEPLNADFDELGKALVKKNKHNVPIAKVSGTIPIGSVEIDCAVLDNETRVLSAKSVFKSFGRSRKGMNSRLEVDGTNIPPFLAAKNLKPYITQEVMGWTKPVEYMDGNQLKTGYAARLLPVMCKIYLDARRDGALTSSQKKLADQSEILLTAFAQVGIDALVDEATGYQYTREHDALRILLARYVEEGIRKWVKTFPDTFFTELDRLYDNEPTTSSKRPQYYGHFINKYVYGPIEHGYLRPELDKKTRGKDGKRSAKFHQWLSDEGKSVLMLQLG